RVHVEPTKTHLLQLIDLPEQLRDAQPCVPRPERRAAILGGGAAKERQIKLAARSVARVKFKCRMRFGHGSPNRLRGDVSRERACDQFAARSMPDIVKAFRRIV